MANAAAKKLAQANTASLKQLHAISFAVNGFFWLVFLLWPRNISLKYYIFMSLPAFFLQWQLERIGRPRYDSKGLVKAGEDMNQKGLTEWFHDIIYVTLICDVVVAIFGSNWPWLLYFSIPVYAVTKIYLTFFKGKSSQHVSDESTAQKSKRQEKLEKRGGRKVVYR